MIRLPRRIPKDVPVYRETPLDHWSTDIDPVIMSGDEWIDDKRDPGQERIIEKQGGTIIRERFMHPTLDTNHGLEDDAMNTAVQDVSTPDTTDKDFAANQE